MQYSLLKMVQLILSSMDSDEVDDIFDTSESTQIVDIIEQTYNDLSSQVEFPDQWDLFELTPSETVTRPTVMYMPEDVAKIEWIRYNHGEGDERDFRPVIPMERRMFLSRMNELDSSKSDIFNYEYLVGSDTFDIRGYNNKNPTYFTTVDNRTLIFDSYDANVGQSLQGNRTECYGMKIPVFVRDNAFVAQFEPRQFTLFFNEAKSQCFSELKQITNAKAEQRARRGWVHSQRKKDNTDASPIHNTWTPNYGRNRRCR